MLLTRLKLTLHLKLQPSVNVIPDVFKLQAVHRLGNGLDIVLRLYDNVRTVLDV
jgi:hypothetical protein